MAFDVRRNTPFTIQVIHDQVDTKEYVLTENDLELGRVPPLPAGVQFQFPDGKPPGTYVYVVTAIGLEEVDGVVDAAPSDPVTWVVGHAVPSKPHLKITITVS